MSTEGRTTTCDLSLIASIVNPADVSKYLQDVIQEEGSVNANLETMLQRRHTFEELLGTAIQETEEVLEIIHTDGEQLTTSVRKAAKVAEGISGIVKELDMAQSNVKAALDYIHLLTDRSGCVHRLRDSMERRDYETAAACMTQFHELEDKINRPPEPHQQQAVGEMEVLLLDAVREELKKAVQKDEMGEILKFSKLFIPLRKGEEGFLAFSDYWKTSVARCGHEQYQKLSNALESQSGTPGFVDRLSELLRFVAISIEDHQEMLKTSFGAEATVEALEKLHLECDNYGARILKRFVEARNVKRIVQEIALHRKKDNSSNRTSSANLMMSSPGGAGGTSFALTVDPRSTESILMEVLALVRRCEEYTDVISRKMKDISDPQPIAPTRFLLFQKSQLGFLSRELSAYYVTLEEFYIEENTKKAISIDSRIPGSLVSSMVDDVFFICRKSATRSLSSANVPCVCAVLSLMNTLLSKDYMTAMQRPLMNGPSFFIQAMLSDQEQEDTSQFGLYLNDVQVSLTYVSKLKSELVQRIDGIFAISNEREIASSLLDDLASISLQMERLLEVKIGNVCDALMTILMTVLQEIPMMNYQLTEEDYEQLTETETWSHRTLNTVRHFSSSLESRLTSENHTQVLDRLIQLLVSRCEAQFMQKSFNQLGGLQFDRDVRLLVTHLSEIMQSPVREKFARLTQMAIVLSFETVEEMLDYWGDEGGSINWRLSPAEIKSILKLRNEFNETDISALLL